MSNIVKFYSNDAAKNPDAVLEQAVGTYSKVLVVGYDKANCIDARANSTLTNADILWLLEIFKREILLNLVEEDFDE